MKDRQPLTPLQKKVFHWIRAYQKKYMLSPSGGEIAASKDFECSRSNAFALINRLEKKGWITRNEKGSINRIES
jgi:SOS-response transcriptional repressor LexA